jgi:hypothetical protein
MIRSKRLALAGAIVLLLVLAGTVLATRAPQLADEPQQLASSHEPQAEAEDGGADGVTRAGERLTEAGIAVDEAVLADLATRYGVGGAVRIVAWADATGLSVDEITQMRDGDGTEGSGMGWGRIAKELDVHPGLGAIMGNGGGHGRDNAPGQEDKGETGADD